MTSETLPEGSNTGEATVVRVLDAPRELVWKYWTEPALFAAWFSTPPFTTPASTVHMDVEVGGEWAATQVAEDGTELPFVGVYMEVVWPERLSFTFEDPTDRNSQNFELATVTFEVEDGKTKMTLHQAGHIPPEQYPLLVQGYSHFFDQLETQLTKG